MSRIEIEVATEADNEELLRLMAEVDMPGSVRVAYCRSPSFFDALRVEGRTRQVIVGRDTRSGRLAGMGSRSSKPMYVNGVMMEVGYLSSLRVAEEYRRTPNLARGYEKLRTLHEDGKARIYLSTVLNGNFPARRLTTGRGRLPAYHDVGEFRSLAIALRQFVGAGTSGRVRIRPATRDDVPLLAHFLNDEGRRRQFFPAYSPGDFFRGDGLLPGLFPEDVWMAFSSGRLEGVVAGWDQKAFRRSVVTGYGPWLRGVRMLYNGYAWGAGLPQLPPVGGVLNYCYLALVCIRGDDGGTFSALLERLARSRRGACSFLMAGMHERDPLLPALLRLRHWEYPSRLYVVCWPDGEALLAELDDRVPYLELGSL
jgi:hypothetical protein